MSSEFNREGVMGLAEYMIVAQGDEWGVLHDGSINNLYATKESAFEAAVAAAIAFGKIPISYPQRLNVYPSPPRKRGSRG